MGHEHNKQKNAQQSCGYNRIIGLSVTQFNSMLGYTTTELLFFAMYTIKQAPAELEEDATPKSAIEKGFSINIYLFI